MYGICLRDRNQIQIHLKMVVGNPLKVECYMIRNSYITFAQIFVVSRQGWLWVKNENYLEIQMFIDFSDCFPSYFMLYSEVLFKLSIVTISSLIFIISSEIWKRCGYFMSLIQISWLAQRRGLPVTSSVSKPLSVCTQN